MIVELVIHAEDNRKSIANQSVMNVPNNLPLSTVDFHFPIKTIAQYCVL